MRKFCLALAALLALSLPAGVARAEMLTLGDLSVTYTLPPGYELIDDAGYAAQVELARLYLPEETYDVRIYADPLALEEKPLIAVAWSKDDPGKEYALAYYARVRDELAREVEAKTLPDAVETFGVTESSISTLKTRGMASQAGEERVALTLSSFLLVQGRQITVNQCILLDAGAASETVIEQFKAEATVCLEGMAFPLGRAPFKSVIGWMYPTKANNSVPALIIFCLLGVGVYLFRKRKEREYMARDQQKAEERARQLAQQQRNEE